MKSEEFVRLNQIYMFYICGIFLGWNIIDLYFIKSGFTYLEISMYYLLFSVSSLISIISLSGLKIAKAIRFSQTLRIWSIVLVAFFLSKPMPIVAKLLLFTIGILIGITIELFWIPYYSRYEEFTREKKAVKSVENLKNLSFILKVIAPAIGGLIAATFGWAVLFGICIIIFILNIISSRGINKNDAVIFNWIDSLKGTSGIKTLVLIEGIWQTVPFMIIPLLTTKFLSTEVSYGAFMSYLAIFTLIGFYTTKKTNISQKIFLLYPLTLLTGVLTMVCFFATDTISWVIMVGCMTLIWKFAEALTTTVIIEKSNDFAKGVVSRRFFISLGRAVGSLITAIILITFGRTRIDLALIVLGAVLMLYPAILFLKRDVIASRTKINAKA